ncbi:MAG: pseudouridine synthase [Candidatus Omnitrophota bacterium]|jgi:23S rRNA pseudouridine2605 synthase
MQRVQKLLNNYGYCSRRRAEELIQQKRVTVNGRVITVGDKASESDRIRVDGKLIREQKRIYLMFNKPTGCITALKDKSFRTVMDYINFKKRVFPVGRLDYNTSGLLLFTNDGDFANRITHPRYQVNKTYLVGLNKPITNKEIQLIEAGLELEDGKSRPAKVKKIKPALLEVTIHEGKNRIIRRIFEKLNFKLRFLKRLRVGNLSLGELRPGKYRVLSKRDRERIFGINHEGKNFLSPH